MSHRARPRVATAMAIALGVSTLVPGAALAADDRALVYVISSDITSLNNAADDGPTNAVNQWLYNGLYAYDEQLRPVPDIAAELAEVNDDGTVWTVRLRDDVYFGPTGERLTAEDVVFTYQLAMSEECSYNPAACLAFLTVTPDGAADPVPAVQEVEALDDLTVRFTLADTYAPFSTRILPNMNIESRTATMDAFERFNEQVERVSLPDVETTLAAMDATEDATPFRDDAESLLTVAGLELPDVAAFVAEDGELDEAGYTEALRADLADLHRVLVSEEVDRVAAAYRYLDTAHAPVGTGPYHLTEFRSGQDLTAARNERYHHGPPAFESLHVPIIKDDVASAMALASGEIEWKPSFSADAYAQVRDADGLKFARYPDFGYLSLQFNLREGRLFHEKAVRKALAYCIDKAATVEAATDGDGIPIYADLSPASWAYNPDLPRYEQDVDRANSLLEDAGWVMGDDDVRAKQGRRLQTAMFVRAGKPDRVKFLRLLAQQAQECGFDLSVREADFSLLLPGLFWPLVMAGEEEQWDAYFGGWDMGYDPDPYDLWHSSNCTTEQRPDEWNYICFQNERADQLIEAGARELDQTKRTEIYHEFEAILAEELPNLWGWSEEARHGLDADIHGAEPWTEEVMSSPTWFWELEKINQGGFAVPD